MPTGERDAIQVEEELLERVEERPVGEHADALALVHAAAAAVVIVLLRGLRGGGGGARAGGGRQSEDAPLRRRQRAVAAHVEHHCRPVHLKQRWPLRTPAKQRWPLRTPRNMATEYTRKKKTAAPHTRHTTEYNDDGFVHLKTKTAASYT